MTDVFAAERIIWVEGPTEEIYFPTSKDTMQRLAQWDYRDICDRDWRLQRQENTSRLGLRGIPKAEQSYRATRDKPLRSALIERRFQRSKCPNLSETPADALLFSLAAISNATCLIRRLLPAFINSQVPDLAQKVTGADVLPCLQKSGGDPGFQS